MLVLDELGSYLDFSEALACARRILAAWEQGEQPAAVAAWGLLSAAAEVERATAASPAWLEDIE